MRMSSGRWKLGAEVKLAKNTGWSGLVAARYRSIASVIDSQFNSQLAPCSRPLTFTLLVVHSGIKQGQQLPDELGRNVYAQAALGAVQAQGKEAQAGAICGGHVCHKRAGLRH